MTFSQKGLDRMQDILGVKGEDAISRLSKISPDFARYIVDFAYADFYSRDALTDKQKELVAVASLISQKNNGLPLKAHIKGMLNVGWKQSEIIELIIFLTGYVGFPSTVEAMLCAQEVFDAQ